MIGERPPGHNVRLSLQRSGLLWPIGQWEPMHVDDVVASAAACGDDAVRPRGAAKELELQDSSGPGVPVGLGEIGRDRNRLAGLQGLAQFGPQQPGDLVGAAGHFAQALDPEKGTDDRECLGKLHRRPVPGPQARHSLPHIE